MHLEVDSILLVSKSASYLVCFIQFEFFNLVCYS